MFSEILLCCLNFILILIPGSEARIFANQNLNSDFYTQGVAVKDSGDWEQALKIWWDGRNALERQGLTDPRIGIAFIQLATEMQVTRYYGTACELYFWGFSETNIAKHMDVVNEEFERISPLLGDIEREVWRLSLEQKDESISRKIEEFWLQRDPTPTTPVNERLIEHWERIALTRKTFRKNSNTVYGTDDRGVIFVKYGEPDLKKISSFGISSQTELFRWVRNVSRREEIRFLDTNPDYEVWIYYGLNREESTIFIFGRAAGTSYGLRNGVEEFISEYAYLRGGRHVLQIMYYSELVGLDPFFEDRYYRLEEIWDAAESRRNFPRDRLLNLFYMGNKAVDRFNPAYKYASPEKSSYHDVISPIRVIAKNFRFLNDTNSPQNAIMVFSYPKFKNLHEFKQDSDNFETIEYALKHTLIQRDVDLNEIDRLTDFVIEDLDYPSTFILDQVDPNVSFSIAAEAFTMSDFASKGAEVSLQPKTRVIANGAVFLSPSTPLNKDKKILELSDLALGVVIPENLDESKFLFPLLPSARIWEQDKLKIYLEIYHLYPAEDGMSSFSIDFRIAKLSKSGKSKRKKSKITLTFEFESPTPTSKENFEVDISKLSPGNYELSAMVSDKVSLQQKTRSTTFEVYK